MGQTPRRAQDCIRSLDPVLSFFSLFPMWRVIIPFNMLVFPSINWSREETRGIVGVLEVLVEYSGGQKL